MNKRERKDLDLARAALIAVKDLADRGIDAHRQLIENLEQVARSAETALKGLKSLA